MVPAFYRLTAALLIAHEIDAAYWREWEVLGLPGGAAAFVLLHVPLAIAMIWGAERLALRGRGGRVLAFGVAVAALLTVAVHAALLPLEPGPFSTPASLALVALAGLSGLALLVALVRGKGRPAFPGPVPRLRAGPPSWS